MIHGELIGFSIGFEKDDLMGYRQPFHDWIGLFCLQFEWAFYVSKLGSCIQNSSILGLNRDWFIGTMSNTWNSTFHISTRGYYFYGRNNIKKRLKNSRNICCFIDPSNSSYDINTCIHM